jgi:hypothetical protein
MKSRQSNGIMLGVLGIFLLALLAYGVSRALPGIADSDATDAVKLPTAGVICCDDGGNPDDPERTGEQSVLGAGAVILYFGVILLVVAGLVYFAMRWGIASERERLIARGHD